MKLLFLAEKLLGIIGIADNGGTLELMESRMQSDDVKCLNFFTRRTVGLTS
jgi:hypothetical protein